jgi:peptide/nickel transport system substrate-binding protein
LVQDFRSHLASVQRGDHDLCLHGWVGDNGDPDNFLYVLFVSDNARPGLARNVAFYRDPELDELLHAAQRSESRAERQGIYARAQERISRQAPWVPLAHAEVAVAARRDVGGIVINPNAHIEFREVERVAR